MDFKNATDSLFDRVSHDDLAAQMGVSIAAIRQARLDVSAHSHRSAPRGWEDAVVALAENRIRHYNELVGALKSEIRG